MNNVVIIRNEKVFYIEKGEPVNHYRGFVNDVISYLGEGGRLTCTYDVINE